MENNTFCVMPWLHLHAWPNGEAYLCCIGDTGNPESVVGDISKDSIADIMNNDKMKSIRKDMLAGKKIPNCKNCYKVEEIKGYSWRKGFNEQFEDVIPSILENTAEDGTIDPKLLYVDFRFSNLCNLECRTCSGELSSSIANTEGRNFSDKYIETLKDKGVYSKGNIIAFSKANEQFTDDLKQYLPDTRCFYFAGGEPLMQKEHFEVLSYIHDNKWFDKELRYSTNLSNLVYKKTDLVELWKDFDNVWIMCSIDHTGEKLEHIRQNVNSERLWKNFDRLVDTHFKLSITFVVSIYNIYYLDEFYQYLDDNNYLERLHSLEMLYVFGDTETPALLPDFAKEQLIKKLRTDLDSELYKELFKIFPGLKESMLGLEEFINGTSSFTFEQFIERTEQFDKVYKTSTKDAIPWLGEIIDHYKT
jgi:sulfatase maturation enzyme AslB (radical SAM superfamily)